MLAILRRRDSSRAVASAAAEADFLPGGWLPAQVVADMVCVDMSQLAWQVNHSFSRATGLHRFEHMRAADGMLLVRAVEIPAEYLED